MNWLTGNWNDLLSFPTTNIALGLASVVCGAIVGIERERMEKAAGLRTMILICLGSTVFTLMSFLLAGNNGDNGRVAAQIVNGIGFLGAGAILRGIYSVKGMTTAATIWAVAAMGMVVGTGYAGAGLAMALVILLVLLSLSAFDNRYLGLCKFAQVTVSYDSLGGKAGVKLDRILDDHHVDHGVRETKPLPNGAAQLSLRYCHVHKHHKEFLSQIAEMHEVNEICRET